MNNQPRQLTHVRSAVYGRPMAISDEGFKDICAIVESHAEGLEVPTIEPKQHWHRMRAQVAAIYGEEILGEEERPYIAVNRCALIPISGTLLATAPAAMFRNISNVTAYGEIADAFSQALRDDAVDCLIPVIFSPGGECVKCFDVCDLIWEAGAGEKMTVGLIDGLGASAAYALASQCRELYCTSHSRVGSIGIVGEHRDTTRMDRNLGIDSDIIRTSELKGVGAGPMSPNQKQAMKSEMMSLFSTFKSLVSRGRPSIDIEAVSTGELWYGVDETRPTAVQMGLVDGISTLEKLIAEFGT